MGFKIYSVFCWLHDAHLLDWEVDAADLLRNCKFNTYSFLCFSGCRMDDIKGQEHWLMRSYSNWLIHVPTVSFPFISDPCISTNVVAVTELISFPVIKHNNSLDHKLGQNQVFSTV